MYLGKTKSFEYPNNKSANDQSVRHNINELKNIRSKNVNNIIIAQININSTKNKFELLSHFVSGNIDILIITETKLDKSFPSGQFLLHGYSEPFRLDRNQFGGGLLVFIREDISCSILNIKQLTIEALFIEINLRKKWLLCCSYNPHKNLIAPICGKYK